MRIPRDMSGEDLAKRLAHFGYRLTRQTGSHMRFTTVENGEHHLTVPNHKNLRIGTIAAIINELSSHFMLSREKIQERLFH